MHLPSHGNLIRKSPMPKVARFQKSVLLNTKFFQFADDEEYACSGGSTVFPKIDLDQDQRRIVPQTRKPRSYSFSTDYDLARAFTPKSVQGVPSGVALAALKVDSWRSACVVSVVKACEWLYPKIFKHLMHSSHTCARIIQVDLKVACRYTSDNKEGCELWRVSLAWIFAIQSAVIIKEELLLSCTPFQTPPPSPDLILYNQLNHQSFI